MLERVFFKKKKKSFGAWADEHASAQILFYFICLFVYLFIGLFQRIKSWEYSSPLAGL